MEEELRKVLISGFFLTFENNVEQSHLKNDFERSLVQVSTWNSRRVRRLQDLL